MPRLCYPYSIRYRINNEITAKELRVVGDKGENLGVLKTEEAISLAKARGLDLIEIAPNANPPVARIMSFDKFRYQKEKEEKKQRRAEKGKELKHVQITPRAALNDLQVKARKAEEFLEKGHNVEINLSLRGREKGNKEWGLKKLNEFIAIIKTPHKILVPPKPGGRGFITQIIKK
ncbi:MAG TPA: translation initiation factor IF-3 [Candidatus Paceibacterota bacterium]|nr:translation initiation factor IF-3 [Candidatus Paceibacterota bacterium]